MARRDRKPEDLDPLDDRFDEPPYALIGRAVVTGVAVLWPAMRDGFKAFRQTLVRGQVKRTARVRRRAAGR